MQGQLTVGLYKILILDEYLPRPARQWIAIRPGMSLSKLGIGPSFGTGEPLVSPEQTTSENSGED